MEYKDTDLVEGPAQALRSRSSVFGHTRDLVQPRIALPPGFALNARNRADGLELLRALESGGVRCG